MQKHTVCFSVKGTPAGQNTWLRYQQNCDEGDPAVHSPIETEEMSHTNPQSDLTQAGCNGRAQGVALLDIYRVQFASPDKSNPIFARNESRLYVGNIQRISTLLDSHSEVQNRNSTSQFGM